MGGGHNLLEHLGFCITVGVTDLAEHFRVYLCGMHLICRFVVALVVFFSLRLQNMNMCKGKRCGTSIENTGCVLW